MKLVEIKDVNKVVNQIKTDIEQLSKIEIPDNKQIKELKKKLAELKTAKRVMEELGQKTDLIDQQIKEIEGQIKKSDIQLTEKQKLLLKLLEQYGVKVNTPKKGNTGKKEIVIFEKDKVLGFSSFAECCRYYNLNVGGDSPKRVFERFLRKNCPEIKVFVNGEVFYNGLKE